ncbi:MAG: rimI [Clostridia bacterium]|jgi:ribosomal-protein-alanine N-acetyltransferase|nr:rimI [Clostridia bacterium]
MKSNNFNIYKMEFNEIDEVINLQINNNKNILPKISIIEDFNNNTAIYFVYKLNNKIIGYIAASLLYDHVDILSVLVDEDSTRNGIASALLSTLLDQVKNIQISDIFLEVRITNTPAQKLYEKFGFKKINIRKKYYIDTQEDALIYKLSI